MEALNPTHIKAVIDLINRGPFFKHLSMVVTELGLGYSKVELVINKQHMNPFGGLHGGVYASAIDTAAYWSAYCELPEESGLVSIDIKVDFLAPILGKKVLIEGKRIKSGKTIFLTEASMTDPSGKILAHGISKLMTTQNQQTIIDATKYLNKEKLPPKYLGSQHAV